MKKLVLFLVVALLILLAFLSLGTKTASQELPDNTTTSQSEAAPAITTIEQPAAKPLPKLTPVAHAASYDSLTEAIVAVLAKKETNNADDCITHKGQSGEIGCFQFVPSTWAGYSKQVFGSVVEMTPENELAVVKGKVAGWLKQGLTPEQIFLQWQQGNYSQCRSGINKHGVKFDSCAYVEDAMHKLNAILNSKG